MPVGSYDYIALLPINEESDTVYLYRFYMDEDENLFLNDILDDDEFEMVADAYDALVDGYEFD